jgi:hypothetical protein
MVPLKCDAKENLYVRGYQAGDLLAAPVVKFSREARREAVFALRSAPGFEKAGDAVDFAVAPNGDVLLLVNKTEKERGVVRFREDGKFDRYMPLTDSFDPNHIAVFASGEILIAGLRFSADNPDAPGEPVTAIFDRTGRHLTDVKLEGDVSFSSRETSQKGHEKEEKEADGKPQGSPPSEEDRYLPVSLGSAVSADDGNIFLMRAEKNPIVFVLNAGGEVSKRLVIRAPEGDYRPISLKVASGRMLLQFEENVRETQPKRNPKQVFSLVDASTGERLVDYVTPPGVGGALACYSANNLTFLAGGQDRTLSLRILTP